MPNWVEGNIRFIGKRENITRMLAEQLECKTEHGGEQTELPFDVEADEYEITLRPVREEGVFGEYFYIKGTKRNFINSWCAMCAEKNGRMVVVFDDYRAAWCVDDEPFQKIAKEYGITIRVVGYEHGMMFRVDTTYPPDGSAWHNGAEWDDVWNFLNDCDFPYMGG